MRLAAAYVENRADEGSMRQANAGYVVIILFSRV
jgi:hypothetical protein